MLRDYQKDALAAIKIDLQKPGASLVVMPTASGKSHVIAAAAKLKKRVLILQPSQELLKQNMDKLLSLVDKKDIGIYSASFKKKEIRMFTFATIQSVYKNPDLFSHISLVIIDESHGLAPRTLGTMYMKFLAGMGNPKVIGFTATAYRIELGYAWLPDERGIKQFTLITMLKLLNRMRHKDMKTNFWKEIIYNISHKTLLDRGYLSPLKYIDHPLLPYAEIPINKSQSDYNLEEYAKAIVGREADILRTIVEAQARFKSILIFCATVEQAQQLQKTIKRSQIVLGTTSKKERFAIVSDFKLGKIQTVFNVGTLTTGFDHPALDCVILLRPTRSLVLYNQMLGRLTRIAAGKKYGTVIDLTGTCRALGRIETFELYKNGNLWDLKTERHPSWHDRVLFRYQVEKPETV